MKGKKKRNAILNDQAVRLQKLLPTEVYNSKYIDFKNFLYLDSLKCL